MPQTGFFSGLRKERRVATAEECQRSIDFVTNAYRAVLDRRTEEIARAKGYSERQIAAILNRP